MKTIGLIGGMSWESTVTYYHVINEKIKEKLGGLHSAKIIMYSVDFDEIEKCQSLGDWEKSGEILANAAKSLEKAGADFIVICTNTMHKVAKQITESVNIPLLHIADATADRLNEKSIKKVALLGTKYTMTQDFYKARLVERGFEVIIPEPNDIEIINSIIYNELCLGKTVEESHNEFKRIISSLAEKGAGGIILGCTEIGLLVHQKDTPLPVFDTAIIHAEAAAEEAVK